MTEKELSRTSTHKCSICGTLYIERFLPLVIYGQDFGKWKVEPKCDCERKLEEEEYKIEKENIKREIEKSKGKELKNLIIKTRDVGIGKRYEGKTFSNFDKEKNKKAYISCINYTKNFPDKLKNGKGLFITGMVGTGKTHLIAAIVDRLARLHKGKLFSGSYSYNEYLQIIYLSATELFSQIRASFEDNETEELIEKYINCSLLIIDDLGVEKTTDFTLEYIYKIIDSRYRKLKSVIIVSNFNDDELKEKLSERVVSRIYEMCKGVKLEGDDYRVKMMGK